MFFGRDSLGRNSLLIGLEEDHLYISSVNGGNLRNQVMELPPLGIFKLNLSEKYFIEILPWTNAILDMEFYSNQLKETREFLKNHLAINVVGDCSINPFWLSVKSENSAEFRFNEVLKDFPIESSSFYKTFDFLLSNPIIHQTCEEFIDLLSNSVSERVKTTPAKCKNCIKSSDSCGHPRIGILFSGGVDCTLLALIANNHIPQNLQIDLLNVSFQKTKCSNTQEINWNVPDRISALQAVEELSKLCPLRIWNLVEVNVLRKDLETALNTHISDAVFPLTSILDESLGGALWFAASGKSESYQSSCRVLLIGSGADELLGGYTRHRTAFKRLGDVTEELLLDWLRLPSRNLARDDRVISDHGITPRAPFVEEKFVHFVRNLNPLQKCFHGLPEGVGDKLLLRLCAYKLGLKETAVRRKKALQFGSRIADSRQNAKDKSRLLE